MMNVQPIKKEAVPIIIAKSLIVKGTKVGEETIIHLAEKALIKKNKVAPWHSFEQGDVTVFSFKDGNEAKSLVAFVKKLGKKFALIPQMLERSQEKEVNYLSRLALAEKEAKPFIVFLKKLGNKFLQGLQMIERPQANKVEYLPHIDLA